MRRDAIGRRSDNFIGRRLIARFMRALCDSAPFRRSAKEKQRVYQRLAKTGNTQKQTNKITTHRGDKSRRPIARYGRRRSSQLPLLNKYHESNLLPRVFSSRQLCRAQGCALVFAHSRRRARCESPPKFFKCPTSFLIALRLNLILNFFFFFQILIKTRKNRRIK